MRGSQVASFSRTMTALSVLLGSCSSSSEAGVSTARGSFAKSDVTLVLAAEEREASFFAAKIWAAEETAEEEEEEAARGPRAEMERGGVLDWFSSSDGFLTKFSSSLMRRLSEAISSSDLDWVWEDDSSFGRFLPRGILASLRHSCCKPLAVHWLQGSLVSHLSFFWRQREQDGVYF